MLPLLIGMVIDLTSFSTQAPALKAPSLSQLSRNNPLEVK